MRLALRLKSTASLMGTASHGQVHTSELEVDSVQRRFMYDYDIWLAVTGMTHELQSFSIGDVYRVSVWSRVEADKIRSRGIIT